MAQYLALARTLLAIVMISASCVVPLTPGMAQTDSTKDQSDNEDEPGGNAMMLAMQGQTARALVEVNRYVALMLQRHGAKSEEYRRAVQQRVLILTLTGNTEAAARSNEQMLKAFPLTNDPHEDSDVEGMRAYQQLGKQASDVNKAAHYELVGNIAAAEDIWRRMVRVAGPGSLLLTPASGFGDFLFRNGKFAEACGFYHRLGQSQGNAPEPDYLQLTANAKEARCLGAMGKSRESDELFRKVAVGVDRLLVRKDSKQRSKIVIPRASKSGHDPQLTQMYAELEQKMNDQLTAISSGAAGMNGLIVGSVADVFEAAGRYKTAEKWRRIVASNSSKLANNPIYKAYSDNFNEPARLALAENLLGQGTPSDEPRTLIATVTRKARSRLYEPSANPEDTLEQDAQRKSSAAYFATMANANWTSHHLAGANSTMLAQDTFLSLQELTGGAATRAVAQAAARSFLEQSAGLGGLARKRESLTEQWRALQAQQNETLSNGASDQALSQLAPLAAEQQRVEASIVDRRAKGTRLAG